MIRGSNQSGVLLKIDAPFVVNHPFVFCFIPACFSRFQISDKNDMESNKFEGFSSTKS